MDQREITALKEKKTLSHRKNFYNCAKLNCYYQTENSSYNIDSQVSTGKTPCASVWAVLLWHNDRETSFKLQIKQKENSVNNDNKNSGNSSKRGLVVRTLVRARHWPLEVAVWGSDGTALITGCGQSSAGTVIKPLAVQL